jgi:2-polyprenyl-6-methoxyphenol hydroxylase-like FAD-dependent oxidoreductase
MDWSQTEFGRRVTIVGDAAHCMPPHRGQGLNNALQDSATLVEELSAVKNGEKTLADAVEAYEKEMKERSLQEIPISVRTALLGHDWKQLMETPAIKMGMNRYKETLASKSDEVELAT